MRDAAVTLLAGITAIALLAAVLLLCGLGLQVGWNLAMPALFGLPQCRYIEGVGLAIVSNILSLSFRVSVTR